MRKSCPNQESLSPRLLSVSEDQTVQSRTTRVTPNMKQYDLTPVSWCTAGTDSQAAATGAPPNMMASPCEATRHTLTVPPEFASTPVA